MLAAAEAEAMVSAAEAVLPAAETWMPERLLPEAVLPAAEAVAEAVLAAVEAVAETLLPLIADIVAEARAQTCRRTSLSRNVSNLSIK